MFSFHAYFPFLHAPSLQLCSLSTNTSYTHTTPYPSEAPYSQKQRQIKKLDKLEERKTLFWKNEKFVGTGAEMENG